MFSLVSTLMGLDKRTEVDMRTTVKIRLRNKESLFGANIFPAQFPMDEGSA